MFSNILSAAIQGINAQIINVETDMSNGLPMFNIVGSPGPEIKEARDRIRAALKNNDITIPASRITVNLSPGDLRKDGTAFDLPMTIGLLTAMEYLPGGCAGNMLFLGELSLDGEIKPVRGVLPIVQTAARNGIKECIIPIDNAKEGSIVPGIKVRGARTITEVIMYLMTKDEDILPSVYTDPLSIIEKCNDIIPDFDQVKGQERAKKAAVISASGFHSFIMTGPPGAGKSMIAKRIPGILPPLSLSESMELTAIYSVAGKMPKGKALVTSRAFQSPHHSISRNALVGGGADPKPGIISLAHRSVLFLDELPEFGRDTIESLRQPLEDKTIHIARVKYSVDYPSDFLLVCAMNPCPCGYYPDRGKCRCTENEIKHYLAKISGPILDRIDLCTELKNIDIYEIRDGKGGISSAEMSEMVMKAREMQDKRFKGTSYRFNSDLKADDMDKYCELGEKEFELMEKLYKELSLSARSYHRILRVARTIADIDGKEYIGSNHLLEAASFRPTMEYFKWG